MAHAPNTLYYGDNLEVMRQHLPDESVDLVYLDPPFNSNTDYNVLFAERGETESSAQIRAFEDTWHWEAAAVEAYYEAVQSSHGRVPDAMQGFRAMLGESDVLAYLAMMAPRLVELHRVLKPTGSIYLHCDPTASHYLKLLMDAVFGAENFQNEIIWAYKSGGATKRRFARKHDVVFFYAKSLKQCRFNPIKEKSYNRGYKPYRFKGVEEYQDETGWYTLVNMKDVWHIDMIGRTAKERLGYPTQKPEALLERIIQASSNEGDVVLDPFCGCGTATAVAQKFNRRWIGIDITHLAVNLIKYRLWDSFRISNKNDPPDYQVLGEPEDIAGAEQLAKDDPFQFQAWALSLVKARTASSSNKGADKGIDGRLFFHDDPDHVTDTKQIVISVKSGKTGVSHVRDLKGVLDREQQRGAVIGVLITLQPPTRQMRSEAAAAGHYASPWGTSHARIQVLTIEGLLNDHERLGMPQTGDLRTFKQAPKSKRNPDQQSSLEYE